MENYITQCKTAVHSIMWHTGVSIAWILFESHCNSVNENVHLIICNAKSCLKSWKADMQHGRALNLYQSPNLFSLMPFYKLTSRGRIC